MNTALLLLGVVLAGSCAALPDGSDGYGGHPYINQTRSVEHNTQLNYTIQPRIPKFKLPTFDRTNRNYVKCSKKTQKVTLKYEDYVWFASPDHPNDYPGKTSCKWQFKSTEDITIACFDFHLEEAKKKKCKDILKIDSTKYCGRQDLIYYEGKKRVKVQFKSNKKKNYSGFNCLAATNVYLPSTYGPSSSPSSEGPTEVPPTVDPNSSCICGTPNRKTRIVGGVSTEVHEYPWQVALVSRGESHVFCGGSLINDRWVLTAAHCTPYGVKQVLLGNHLQSQTDAAERRINVRRVVEHPNYNTKTLENDFSLLELSTPVDLEKVDPEIRPVCLPSASNPSKYEGVPAIVSGWGTTSEGGSQSEALREATVRTMSNAVCNRHYGGAIVNAMICASNSNPARDSCQGDSGGPLVHNVGGYFNQIGVTSWGVGCADPDFPGVYSRVTDAISWITSTSSSGSTCAPPS